MHHEIWGTTLDGVAVYAGRAGSERAGQVETDRLNDLDRHGIVYRLVETDEDTPVAFQPVKLLQS